MMVDYQLDLCCTEGTVVNVKNVLLTIESLDPECAWLTNFLESLFFRFGTQLLLQRFLEEKSCIKGI
jgi:hypothetical protein